MNKAILIGRMTRDPEIRYATTKDGQMAVARFTLAVDRKGKQKEGQQTADFLSCVAFGKTAEVLEKYGRQGLKLAVTGMITTGSYTNKQGVKVYTTDINVDAMEFVESKKAEEKQEPAQDIGNGFIQVPDNIEDEGLPFV